MRIAYTCQYLHLHGGLERIICDKASALARRGHQVCIITDTPPGESLVYDIAPEVEIIHIDIPAPGNIFMRMMSKFRRDLAILSALRSFNPDITIVTPSWISLSFLFGAGKLVMESHCSRSRVYAEERHSAYKRFKTWLAERKAKAVVTLTAEDSESWAAAQRVVTIPNYSNISSSEPFPANPKADALSMVRLSPQKRPLLLVEAWRKVVETIPGATIDIFGDGPLRGEMENLIRRYGLENNVHLRGNTKNPASQYASHRFMVMTSAYEGLPLALIECMQCGRASVAADCPTGPREMITDSTDGILVTSRGKTDKEVAEGIAAGCLRLLQNPDLCEKMGEEAKKASSRYDKEKILDRWERLFETLVAGGRKS